MELIRERISNGMNVLVIPSRQAPVVALQGWVRFGAADETDEIAGLAHLFEHLLFKGTERRRVGQIAREVESLGGDLNAYTTYDHTVMHMTLPSRQLVKGLDILSDSLQHSIVDPDELAREKPVILEEIKRRNDMPSSVASDLFRGELFSGHTYARPVIGYAHVVAEMPREKILEQYRRYYNANNLFLVIAGDVDPKDALAMAEKQLGSLRSGPNPGPRPSTREIRAPMHKFQKHPTSPHAILYLGWQAPPLASDDAAALDALALVLGQGESSRLMQNLVHDKELLRAAGAGYWGPKDTGSFSLSFRGPSGTGKRFGQVLQVVRECLERKFTPSELEKAKKNLLASDTYSKETVDGLAERYAYFESICGDGRADAAYLEHVRALHVEDLERVRDKYLKWEHAVAGGIVPNNDVLPEFKLPTAKAATRPLRKEPAEVEAFDFRGLRVVHKTVTHLPMFSLRWVGWGGKRLEPSDKPGLGTLWARSVSNGGQAPDGKIWQRQELFDFIDRSSAGLSAFHGKNSFGYQLDGLSDDFESLCDALLAIKQAPLFDLREVAREKTHQQQDIKAFWDSPSGIASLFTQQSLFGSHPYGTLDLGTPSALKEYRPRDLVAYHAKCEQQPQVLCVVGDIGRERLLAYLTKRLNTKKFPTKSKLSSVRAIKTLNKTLERRHKLNKEQTHINLSFPTEGLYGRDRDALTGLSALLSGQGGRLFLELRDKMSLCYTVAPMQMSGVDGGYFGFYIATSPEKETVAREGLLREIKRLVTDGIPEKEWNEARNFYVGNHLLDQQRLASQASGMSLDELYGLGFKEYMSFEKRMNSLKTSDLLRVARKYFGKQGEKPYAISVVGPGA